MRVSLFMGALLITLVGVSAVQGQSASFTLTNGSGEQGGAATNSVLLDCDFDSRGWSFGVCAAEGELLIQSLDIGPDLQAVNGGAGPDFFNPMLYPGGATVGVIVSVFDADRLPAGTGHHVHSVTYEVLASVDSTVPVCFCETLGTPPVAAVVVDPFSASVFPSLECGEIAVTPSSAPTVTLITPEAHGMDGGSVVSIIGTGFSPEIENLVIGSTTIPIAQRIGDTLIEAFMPALAPGLYQLALVDDQGALILSVPDAIDVQEPRLPPLSDVTWKRNGDCLELEWRSWTALESITISRDGQLVGEVAGSEQSFLDCGFPGEASYELVGLDDAGRLTAATRIFADSEPCLPVLSMPMTGELRLDLTGTPGQVVPSLFELTQPAPGGIRLVTLAERQTLDGLIQATIYPVGNPGSPVATGITFGTSPVTLGPWPLDAYSPTPMPAGSYVVEYSVFGGTAGVTHFQLISSAITADMGYPYPCPPYAYTHVEPLCGNTPPFVTDISEVIPDFTTIESSSYSSTIVSQVIAQPGLGRILRANSGDVDGNVVRFYWDFGDGTTRTTTTDTVSHMFAAAGIYEVRLTVEDDDGLFGFAAKTLSIKPYLPPTSAVQIEVLNHDPNDTLVPDLSTLDVFRTYTALVVPSIGKAVVPSSVIMQIIDPITGLATATVNPATPTLDPTCFSATFNVSQFPNRDYVTLRVSAQDTGGVFGFNEVVIPLCTRPELGTNFTWSYDVATRVYRVVGQLDLGTLYNQTFSLGSSNLANRLPFRVAYQLRLSQRQWYADSLNAILDVTILGSTKISKSISIKSQYATLLPCPNFGVHYEREDIRLFDWTWGLSIFSNQHLVNTTIFIWGLPVLYVDVYGSLSVAAGFEVDLDIDATLQSIAPHFDLEACFKPKATLSAIGSANLSVSALRKKWKVFTATGTLYPVMTLELPIQLDLEIAPSYFQLLVRDYWTFDIDYRVNGKVLWKAFDTGRRDAVAWNFNFITGPAPTCYVPGGASGTPLESTIEIRSPALATSPDGNRSLLVYVDEIPVASDMTQSTLRFATRDGDSWTSGELVFPFAQGADTEPTAVFTTNDKVWIAWTRNSWTQADVAAITISSDSINAYYRDSEIYCAEYTFGGGWSAPIRVTTDERFQDEAAIAAISGSEVCVTWVTREDPDLLTVDGDLVESPLTIAASFVSAAGPSPCVDISSSVGTPGGVNRAPAIDFAGTSGQVVWVEEGATSSKLVTSAFDGASWSTPAVLLEGVDVALDAPSLVLEAAGAGGVIAYTHEEGLSASTGFGFNQRLGILEFGGGTVIDHVLAADRCLQAAAYGPSTYVSDPQITRLDAPGQYAVTGRAVVAHDPDDVDPEVGLWKLDLSTGDRLLSSVQLLTDDDLDQIEPVVNVQADGRVVAVWNELDGDPAYQGLVTATSELRADLAIGRVLVGNSWAQPGESVSVQVEVENRGLALSESLSPSIQIGTVEAGGFEEIASMDLPFAPGPGESMSATLEFVATTPSSTLEIRVVPGAPDLDDSNDSTVLRLGVESPENVVCEEIEGSEPRQTLVTWQNPQIYDSVMVLRDGIQLVQLTGSAESFVDLDAPSGTHAYSVRGMLRGRGTAAAATCSSSTSFIRGDANGDGMVNLSDPISMLGALFGGVVLSECQDALDANDDGQVNIGDTVSLLSFLFTGGSAPPAPFPACGTDPTGDDLDCLEFPVCP